jgi:hypothetical protein
LVESYGLFHDKSMATKQAQGFLVAITGEDAGMELSVEDLEKAVCELTLSSPTLTFRVPALVPTA